MVAVGIDMGAKNVKAVVLRDGELLGKTLQQTEFDRLASARKAFETVLRTSGIGEKDVDMVVATGGGKKVVNFAQRDYTVMACNAKGIVKLLPSVRTVIDVGAEEARAVRLDETGRVVEFAINEKCAAGAGAFVEAMARALEVDLEEFARMSLTSTKTIPINAQCVIFAESEVVSLVHSETDRSDIAKAVHDAMAARVGAMAQRVKMERDIALVGGVARNVGFLKALREFLKEEIVVPEDPEFVTAYGAAWLGLEAPPEEAKGEV